MFFLKRCFLISIISCLTGGKLFSAQEPKLIDQLSSAKQIEEIAAEYDLQIVSSNRNKYFYVKADLEAEFILSTRSIVLFYLNYVSSDFVCRAGSEVYNIGTSKEESKTAIYGGEYVFVSDVEMTAKNCKEIPISKYFKLEDKFSDGTLISIHEFLKGNHVKKIHQKYNRLYQVGLDRMANNNVVYKAEYICCDNDSERLSVYFDLANENSGFEVLKEQEHIFQF